MKTKRVFADLPETTVNAFLSKAKGKGSTGKAEIEVFVNQYVASKRAYTDTSAQQEGELDNPLAGLSGDDANTIRRLIDAVHSGFPHVAMLKDLLDSHEAKATEHERKEEAPAKGKKHRKQA